MSYDTDVKAVAKSIGSCLLLLDTYPLDFILEKCYT